MGKEVGDDGKEGKVTLPVLAAYEAGSEDDRIFWRRVIEDCEQTPEDLDAALARIAQTNAIGITLNKAEEYAALARQALQDFPETDLKAILLETASYSASRAS